MTQSDVDSDLFGDECDNCPSVANANQADVGETDNGGTADGVGDACDPRPELGGDSLYLFDGLNFTSLPALGAMSAEGPGPIRDRPSPPPSRRGRN